MIYTVKLSFRLFIARLVHDLVLAKFLVSFSKFPFVVPFLSVIRTGSIRKINYGSALDASQPACMCIYELILCFSLAFKSLVIAIDFILMK